MRDQSAEKPTKRSRKPATTPEGRENQLTALAFDLAEKQLREGSASAQVITHFLKLGTAKEELELEKLKSETRLVEAKVEGIESQKRSEVVYGEALEAIKRYSGTPDQGLDLSRVVLDEYGD